MQRRFAMLNGLKDGERAAVRAAIGDVDDAIAGVLSLAATSGSLEPTRSLASSWERLTRLLALEPAAEVRACPHCKERIMRAATRCMFCWKHSEPDTAAR